MRDITLMSNDYIVTHVKTDTICEHFSNDDVVYAVEERVVPLVRCGECKWGSDKQTGEAVYCEWHGFPWNVNGFCSYGSRKE